MTPGTIPVVPLSAMAEPPSHNASAAVFDKIAAEARERTQDAASPGQFGSMVLDNLGGYMERVSRFAEKSPLRDGADAIQVTAPRGGASSIEGGAGGGQPSHIDRIITSLGAVFNYSIETQLVVRGGTQVSGAANTLLRGQ
ncbi:hypothetical protein [Novosphingobium kaempferiae]|uniref:hypothetical protein n=1 Tax=Novosphingobium kaempferiae TaxID=2896849 RepID=UPI001E4BE8D6|nr:hypothetical protein [Novosphingobium kaempferiae]